MKCMIMAGGFGTRLSHLRLAQSKPLVRYRGKPCISHIVEKIPLNIETYVTVNATFKADFSHWKETCSRNLELCIEKTTSDFPKKGAVSALNYWVKRKRFSEDLFVIAGDNYFEDDLSGLLRTYDGNHPLIALYNLGDIARASSFGVVKAEGGRVIELVEKPAQPNSSLIATGCYILPPKTLRNLRDFCRFEVKDNLGEFISYLTTVDRVNAYFLKGKWLDIGDILLDDI